MKIVYCLYFSLISIATLAQRFNYNNNIFGSNNDASIAVKTDQTGHFIGGGFFRNTVNFSTGFNAVNLSSAGQADAFIAKYASVGDLIWARRIGGALNDTLLAIATNLSNEIFTVGSFQGTVDVDPGAGVLSQTATGNGSIFISKLSDLGVFLNGVSFGSTQDITVKDALVHDSLLILTGSFSGTADFNPGAGVTSISAAGGSDAFILLLNQNLQFVNVFTFGGTGNETISAFTKNNNAFYIAGNYAQTVDFNFDNIQSNTSTATGASSSYLLKLNLSFGYDSHLSIGSGFASTISALAGYQNDVLMTINFNDSLLFNNQTFISQGSSDFILARLDAINQLVWLQHAKGMGNDAISGIAIYNSSNILITGIYADTLKITNHTQNNIVAQSSKNGFVCSFRTDGTFNWIYPIAGPGIFQTSQIAASSTHFMLTGNYTGTLDFDAGNSDATYTSNLQDGFFAGYFLNDLGMLSVSQTTACGGESISINYAIYTQLNQGNQLQVELSNAAGNFNNSQTLASISTTSSSGVIHFTVPFNLAESSNYRIRLKTTQPVITGLAFPESFFLRNTPSINGGNDTIICQGQNITLNAGNNFNYVWTGGILNNTSFQPNQSAVYVVSTVATNGCIAYDSVQVTVIPQATGPAIVSSNPAGICLNETVTLSVNSQLQGILWSNNQTTSNIQIQQAGTYQVSYLDSSGCRSANASITLNNLQTPNTPLIVVNGSLQLCQGDSVILSTNFANNNLWSTGATSSSIVIKTSDTITVRRRNNTTGCVSLPSQPAIVSVFQYAPQPSIIASGSTSLCDGETVTLSSSIVGNNNWNGFIMADSIVVQNPGTYFLTQIDPLNGCNSSTSIQIFGLATPFEPTILAQTNISICQGDSILLQTNNSQNLIWSNGSTANSIYINTNGSYFARVINPQTGCISDTSNIVTVNTLPLPSAPIASASSPTFCAGDSVLLSTDIANNIVWSNGMTGQFVYVKFQGSYSAIFTDTNGCSAVSNILTVTRFNRPNPPVVTASGPLTFCQGGSVTLTSNYLNGNFWSNGATTQSTTVNISDTITVVRINNNTQCISLPSLPVIITVNPNPTTPFIQLIGNAVFCSGDSSLIVSNVPGVIWNNNTVGDSSYVFQTGNYQATNQNIFGCTAISNIISINVNQSPAKPIITSSSNSFEFCENDSIIISSNYSFGNQWNSGDTTISLVATQSFSYLVTHTDSNGCVSPLSDTAIVIRKNNPPQPQIVFSGNATICEGDSLLLSSNIAGGNLWNTGVANDSIYAKLGGVYILTQNAGNGCVLGDTLQVFVLPIPLKPSITTSNATTFCEGKKVWLTANRANGHLWNTGETTRSIIVTQSGTYYVQVQDSTGCLSNVSDTVVVTVLPLPVFELDSFRICRNQSDTLFGPPGMAGYLWSTGLSNQNLIVQGSAYAVGPKPFKLTVVDQNGCIYADETTILIDACTNIETISISDKIVLFPNPNNGNFLLNLPPNNQFETIEIFDLNGKLIYSEVISNQQTTIQLQTKLAKGMYVLNLNNKISSEKLRFIVH